jgi:uncharacterized phage-associated protein
MERRMANSISVANRLLELAEAKGDSLTPMQLLKLVYIAHGWMLGLYSKPLINERVEAWQYGPVIPALYGHLRQYRGAPVSKKIKTLFNNPELDDVENDVVKQVYDAYSKFSGVQLSRMTHADGTPWANTYERGSFGKVIPVDLIEDHYKQLAARSGGNT